MTENSSQQRTTEGKNKVAFLALKEDISEALEKGWSITAIWETLHDEGSFTASYNTFRLYIMKYINGQKLGHSLKDPIENHHHRTIKNIDKLL